MSQKKQKRKGTAPFFWPDRTGASPAVTSAVLRHCSYWALGPINTFDTILWLWWEPFEIESMTENFSYIRTGSLLAQPEPPSDIIPIPIPVFRPAVPVKDHESAPLECAILQDLAEIKREVRALRAQSATLNALAMPLDRAAEMLGCKRSQVFNLLAHGRLDRAPKVGRSAMITVASIEALLSEGFLRKGNTRARRPDQQPNLVHAQARSRTCEKNAEGVGHDPGLAIRQLRF
ncbi:hypothetical protein [Corallococcus interemptor]|uniref:hypothetical protein n=1 Tax=Corallococcus interemptor TaxID=2316720 RepID=UPI0011C402D9|nr:hypothetical protein [Corallococcus interemptor]